MISATPACDRADHHVRLPALEVIGGRIGEPGLVTGAFLAAAALAAVLVALGWVMAYKHGVVLTDRRLLVFG